MVIAMALYGVYSEVGKLRKVLVHRPDNSLKRLAPSNYQELLFDDVLCVKKTRWEHDVFVDQMRSRGIEVLLFSELLAETMQDSSARKWLLDRKITSNELGVTLSQELRDGLGEMEASKLANLLTAGLTFGELPRDLKAIGLARYAGVPVWNSLTNEAHPTQVLADLLTMQEHVHKPLEEVTFCFLVDVGYNMADSLLVGGAKVGMDTRPVGPRTTWPVESCLSQVRAIAEETGGRITVTEDAEDAVRGCDFLYTDVCVSMGEPLICGLSASN
jgi:hypothetical protein